MFVTTHVRISHYTARVTYSAAQIYVHNIVFDMISQLFMLHVDVVHCIGFLEQTAIQARYIQAAVSLR